MTLIAITPRHFVTAVGAAAFASLAAGRPQMSPQIPPSVAQGMMSTAAAGLVWNNGVPNGGASEIVVRGPGAAPGMPTQWSSSRFGPAAGNHPDYSMPALLASWPTLTTPVEFADVSTGGDIIPQVKADGTLQMGNMWYGLSIMVDGGAAGQTNSLIQQRVAAGLSVVGTVFSYYAEGSKGIDPNLVGKTFIEQTYEQLGYSSGGPGHLTGLDWGMGLISVDPNARGNPYFPVRNALYFTVTKSWADANQNVDFLSNTPGVNPPNARSIYVQYWTGVPGSYNWGEPALAFSDVELGLEHINDEIDMLSVYNFNGNCRVVLSTVPGGHAPNRDQILVYQRAQNGAPLCPTTALKTQSGVRVSERIGLQGGPNDPDNVRGGCGKDPETAALSGILGTPVEQSGGMFQANAMGSSSFRQQPPADVPSTIVDVIHLEASGTDIGVNNVAGALEFQFGLLPAGASTTDQIVWFHWSYAAVAPGQTTAATVFPGNVALPPGLDPRVHFRGLLHTFNGSTWKLNERETVWSGLVY